MADPANNSNEAAGTTVGRPVDEEKREKIIGIARELFMRQGFQAVSLNQIAKQAGVSRTTIYNQFKDKQGLLAEIADDTTRLVAPDLMLDQDLQNRPLREVLERVGSSLLNYLEQDLVVHAHRTLALESERHPEFSRTFFEHGPKRVRAALAALLEQAHQRGEVQVPDSDKAARYLISLWKGEYYMELQFNVSEPRSDIERREHVTESTAFFLRGVAAE